jgi:hypothetical protein
LSTPRPPRPSSPGLARQVREQFVTQAEKALAPLEQLIQARMDEAIETSVSSKEMHERHDARLEFDRKGRAWLQATASAWRKAIAPPTDTGRLRMDASTLELIGDEVVERKILSSRLALAIREHASWELNDLRVRMQHLEGGEGIGAADVLRPEALSQLVVEQWDAAGLTRDGWSMAHDVIQRSLAEHVPKAYHAANEFLVANGVLRDIDLSSRVKRAAAAAARRSAPDGSTPQEPGEAPADGGHWGGGASASQTGGSAGYQGGGGHPGSWSGGSSMGGAAGGTTAGGYHGGGASHGGSPATRQGAGAGAGPAGGRGGVADETRLMTSRPTLSARARRATGVLGQLKRFLRDRVAGFDGPPPTQPSPALTEAFAEDQQTLHDTEVQGSAGVAIVYDDAAVQQAAVDLRRRTGELKKKAGTQTEKAIIEIVALMFQSILAEERIPPAIRVWFARLQMPVLRVAIAEPEFFGSLEHPARQLIDRMGSCVMGFNAAAISGSALETEIKRVVQVIEQYPETGRRVFQLVYDEFVQFLSRFLTEKGSTQRLVTVAQQVEQKETLAIQYTIELRSMLADMPVREEIREFLFKVWAEVLALAAVKHGPQHEDTRTLKNCASELVWAASAKPNRSERARVIHDLPRLLQRLRHGMSLIGMEGQEQETQIKTIGDILADAFLLKTEAIPRDRIEEMANRLAHLEEFVTADSTADLPLDAESIELMLGIDASMIEVVADGGSKPSSAMVAWAGELQVGHWFTLDHSGTTVQVQYAWRSERRHLHLFAAPDGRSYLIQAGRLAAYLQAGLLLPNEEEALTVRATRDALAKLDANPERLLQ